MKRLWCMVALLSSSALGCGYIPKDLYDWSQYYAHKFGLDGDLVVALVWVESQYCVKAVSPDNAQGLGQLMPGTAAQMGVTNPFDPVQNLYGSAKYLRQQWDTFRSWELALAAYNAGPQNVKDYGGIPPFEETQAYVQKVLGTYRAIKLQGLHWKGG